MEAPLKRRGGFKMSCLILRSFTAGSLLSAAARQRAKEYLISIGYREEQLKSIVWPEGAVSAYRGHVGAPWEFTTKADILRGKCERMKQSLRMKREYGVIHRRALYVWVFWCPGVGGFAFRGWWTYIIGCGVEHGGKYTQASGLILQAMGLFPIIEPTLFEEDREYRERWMKEFAKRYQRGLWCGKPQGKAPIWAEVQGNSIKKILGRAQWARVTA